MTTLRISNGDMVPSNGTGIIETVTSTEEGAQNIARSLLLEYNSFYDEGNEFLNFISGSVTPFMTDALVQQFLTEAINRLIIKQRDTEIEGKILQVNQIKTRLVGWTTLVFLVEVLFANGQTVTIVDKAKIQPTKLDHILNSGSLITV
jgi:hypothetical protein